MKITLLQSSRDKTTQLTAEPSWPDVVSMLSQHDRRPEKEGRGFSPAEYREGCSCADQRGLCPKEQGHLLKVNVVRVHMLAIDLDKSKHGGVLGHPEAVEILSKLLKSGVRGVAHTTHSHAPAEKSTWRLFFALSRPVTGPEFKMFWQAALAFLDVPSGIKTDNPARFWYLPSCPEGSSPQHLELKGEPLDVDMLLKDYRPEPVSTQNVDRVDTPSKYEPATPELLAHAAQCLQDHGQAISEQGGNNHTFIAANVLLNDLALTYNEAWPMFRAWNQRNVPPWSDQELAGKLHCNYAQEKFGLARDTWEFHKVLTSPIITGDAGTWAHELSTARADIALVLGEAKNAELPKPFFQSAQSIMTTNFPATPWLVRGLITEGGIGALATEPKSAKTWAATEIAIAVALGDKVFGEFQAEKGTVAYYYAEDMGVSIRNRLRSMSRDGKAPENLHCQPRGRDFDLCSDESLAIMLASARQLGEVKLLVLDPFRDIHSSAEDSSDEMSAVMKRLKVLGRLLKCTVLFVHHSAKSGADVSTRRQGQRMRGSSVVHASLDFGIFFSGLGGNGENEFSNQVLSEVKGAKGAGNFNLTLMIEDGADGTAVKAIWEVSRGEAIDDEHLSELVDHIGMCAHRKEPPPTAVVLLKTLKGRRQDLDKNLLSAESKGLIERFKVGAMGVSRGWILTDEGRRVFAEIQKLKG